MPLEEALTGVDMASSLPATIPEVRTVAARSRDILLEVGARPMVERLDALVLHAEDGDVPAAAAAADMGSKASVAPDSG